MKRIHTTDPTSCKPSKVTTLEEGEMRTQQQGCLFPGCQRPIHAAEGTAPMESQACGNLHHLLVMCSRYCCLFPQYKPILEDFYTMGSFDTAVCALASCNSKPCVEEGHRWCSAQHYLQWLRSFNQNLSPHQVCRLPGCRKHVYVERKSDGSSPLKVHEFCGWRHCQKFHMRQSPADPTATSTDESKVRQLEPSVDYVIESLKKYVCNKTNVPKTVRIDEEFFIKHPWEVLNKPGHQACWLIAKCRWKDRSALKRELITKEGYHWKQQGKAFPHSDEVAKKYLTYTRLRQGKSKGKAGQDDIEEKPDGCNERLFSMIEYTVTTSDHPECKDYCVVKLQRGQYNSPPSIPRKRKRNRGDQPTQGSSSCINDDVEQLGLQAGTGNNYYCAMQEGGDNDNNGLHHHHMELEWYNPDDDHAMLQLLQHELDQGFSSPALPPPDTLWDLESFTLSDLESFIPNDV